MDLEDWLRSAVADAERRGLAELTPMLETLARATAALRKADLASREADSQPERDRSR
jgi:hypothetical protein